MKHRRTLLFFVIFGGLAAAFLGLISLQQVNAAPGDAAKCAEWVNNYVKTDSARETTRQGKTYLLDSGDSVIWLRCKQNKDCTIDSSLSTGATGDFVKSCKSGTSSGGGSTTGGIPDAPANISDEWKPLINAYCGPTSGQQKTDCTAAVANAAKNCGLPLRTECFTKSNIISLYRNKYPSAYIPSSAVLDKALKEANLAAEGADRAACEKDETKEFVDGECVDKDTVTCAVEGIGWVVCPTLQFIADLNDTAYSFLAGSFLQVEPKLLTDDTTQRAWKGFRDIANGLFVIAFMIIIYSQLTGGGGRS